MSTRSVVARVEGDGFRGRYVHSDGYPTGRGPELFKLFQQTFQGDAEAMLRVICDEHYGWSSLDVTAGTPDSYTMRQYNDPLGPGHSDGRFACVERVGIAYTEVDGQSSPDMWETLETPSIFLEWAYAIDPASKTLTVFEGTAEGAERTPIWTLRAVTKLDGPEPSWQDIECGEFGERCGYVEGYHQHKEQTAAASG